MAQPRTQQDQIQTINVQPQALKRWVEALPRGSVGKTGELIFNALKNISQQELKPADRFQALELLRDSVHYITANMNKHINGVAYPLPDKIIRIASACQSIHDHLAQGYMKVFHSLQKQNALMVDKKMLTTAIHRSIFSIEHSLLVTYEIYSAFYHDYWEQLHELYQYAELHKLVNTSVPDALAQSKQKSCIIDEYLRTLLLYLAEPYHLRPGEISEVHEHLRKWTHLCRLEKMQVNTTLAETSLPVIELDSDQPPKLASNGILISKIENCRIINTDQLIQTLKEEHTQLTKDRPSLAKQISAHSISISLHRRLIESWEHSRKRRFPRQSLNDKVNVTIGLHQAHMQLMYEQHLKVTKHDKHAYSGFHQKPVFETIEIKNVEDEHSDVWSTVYAWANSVCPKSEQRATTARSEGNNKSQSIVDYRVKQDNWTLTNESAEGFGLISTNNLSHKVQVGEIISVQQKNSTERSIGLVRWMKALDKNKIEMGVMLLAPSAKPIGLIIDDPATGDLVVDRGLLLPLMQVLNQPESLLSFSRQYKPGDVLRINRPGMENARIKLIKLIADNGSVSQFLFTRIENSLFDDETSSPGKENDINRFNDIWQHI